MSRRLWRGALGGALLALIGVWGAWVPHKDAGLVLSGWDLTEWVKFLPGVRAGTESITRELFYLPVWCLGLIFALLGNQPIEGRTAHSRRLALMAWSLALTLLILPPYPFVKTAYQSHEFRGQFYLGLSGALLVLLSPLTRRLSDRATGALWVALALLGGGPALWQFSLVRPKIQALYGSTLGWGWGLLALVAGLGGVLAVGVWRVAGRRELKIEGGEETEETD
jgi:hypothetical protein